MTTGTDVYTEARELIGTPYVHQGRKKDIGIDCIGVPIWVAKRLDLGDFDKLDYPLTFHGISETPSRTGFPPKAYFQ